jgi:lycopene beta-cyclase
LRIEMDRLQYLGLMLGCLLLTLPLEFVFDARVWRRPRRLLTALTPAFLVFVVWDLWASATETWRFNRAYTIGLRLPGGMAVEELLFFVTIPVCALLTLESVRNVLSGRAFPFARRAVGR